MNKTRKWPSRAIYMLIALALVAGLSLVAVPVGASSIGTVTVTVSPSTESLAAAYTLDFTISTALAADTGTINIEFTDYGAGLIPDMTADTIARITINGDLVPVSSTGDGDDMGDSVDLNEIKLTVPEDLNAGATVQIIIPKAVGITNPTAGSKTLEVETSSDTADKASTPYIISGYSGKGVNVYTNLGVFVNSYTTIQAAENVCSTGYTIEVEPGTYDEDVTVNQATLITLKSTGGKDVTTIIGQMTIAGAADSFTIGGSEGHGFTFEGDTTNTRHLFFGTDTDHVTISYNDFVSKTGVATFTCIWLPNTCTDLTVTENTFTLKNLYDMGLQSHAQHTLTQFTITNNTFTGAGNTLDHSGVELKKLSIESTDTTISGNTFSNLYVGCQIGSDQDAGAGLITDAEAGTLKIQGNTFDSCRYGLDIVHSETGTSEDQNLVVVGNTFSDCTYYGMDIDYGPAPMGTDDLDPGDYTVKFNNFSGNTLGGLYNNKAENVDVALNWWGDASGPGGAGPGSGDIISNYVSPYSPYLGAGVSAADYVLSASTLHRQSTVGVDVTSSDSATAIGVAKYTGNPQGTHVFTALSYFDVYALATTWTGDVVTIKLYDTSVTSSSKVYFWNDSASAWVECYEQGASSGYVWAKVRAYNAVYPERVPVLTDLVNLPFAISTTEAEEPTEPADYDTDDSGLVEIDELLNAISDYIGGVTGVDISLLLEVIAAYINETPV